MPQLVVDASVALKWFVAETDASQANRLLQPGNDLLAPAYFFIELANALRTSCTLQRISGPLASQALADARSYFARTIDDALLIGPAFDLALRIGHPVYDCLYLAAAQREAAQLITADAKFVAKLSATPFARDVVLLSDWKG